MILSRLRAHPFAVDAFLRRTLVLAYALPADLVRPLLAPGLELDEYAGHGLVAVALAQTEGLRPALLPRLLGRDFFLSGYRVFCRLGGRKGSLRGLRILRSDTDRALMALAGNLFTHYRYRRARVDIADRDGWLEVRVTTPNAEADLEVRADIGHRPGPLPAGTPFPNLAEARRYAGPLPYTFGFEPRTRSIISVRGLRENWEPQPVRVEVAKATFFRQACFKGVVPLLANAFYVENVPYHWERGAKIAL